MINPAELVSNLVDLLRDIPALVTEMGDDPTRIFAYHDRYPKTVNRALAIYEMPSPACMVAWGGSGPGQRGAFEVRVHRISVYLHARETDPNADPTDYYLLYKLITEGVPTSGDGQPLQYTTVHTGCDPMDTPSIQPQTGQAGMDFFEMTLSFTEIGDG